MPQPARSSLARPAPAPRAQRFAIRSTAAAPQRRFAPALAPAIALLALAWAPAADASCDVIPQAETHFRGTRGAVDRPFASPGDWVEVSASGCAGTGSLAGLQRPVVSLAFLGDEASRSTLVVLAPSCGAIAERLDACEQQTGRRPRCLATRPCSTGADERPCGVQRIAPDALRFRFPDTRELDADPLAGFDGDLTLSGPARIAVTAGNEALPCALADAGCDAVGSSARACVDALLAPETGCTGPPHRTFPHFTALPLPADYQALCSPDSPPCTGLASEIRFATDTDGNLLLPVDWRGVLFDRDAVPVPRSVSAIVEAEAFAGTGAPLLIPSPRVLASFSTRGARVDPIFDPRFDPDAGTAGARFFGTADAARTVLRVARHDASPDAQRQCASGARAGRACIDDASCLGAPCTEEITCFANGVATAIACDTAADCAPGQECGPPLFEFRDRRVAGIGPVVLRKNHCLGGSAPVAACSTDADCPGGQCVRFDLASRDPIPIEGLIQTPELNAFVREEAISGMDLNGDDDARDHVATLADRRSGIDRPIGKAGAKGRAVARVRRPPFSFPALAAEGAEIAFLEPEPLQGFDDANGNLLVFDTLLRVFRLDLGAAVDRLGGATIAADAAPLVDGRSLSFSAGHLFYRGPRHGEAPWLMRRVSVPMRPDDPAPIELSELGVATSGDGRFVAFPSSRGDLVEGDHNGLFDVFVHDRESQTTTLVSRSPEFESDGHSVYPSLSDDGRFVAFSSDASVLDTVCGPQGFTTHAYVHDRDADRDGIFDETEPGATATSCVSRNAAGEPGNGDSGFDFPAGPHLSGDGRFVVFTSDATNLAGDDFNGVRDVFVVDRDADEDGVFDELEPGAFAVARASQPRDGRDANGRSGFLGIDISADGRFVAFGSAATNLVPGSGFLRHVYVYDRLTRDLEIVSRARDGTLANNDSYEPSLSADGRFVAFVSYSNNLVPGDDNPTAFDVFVKDRRTGEVEKVSVASDGGAGDVVDPTPPGEAPSQNARTPSISADGRFVAFHSDFSGLDPRGGGDRTDIYLHDRLTRLTASLTSAQSSGFRGITANESLSADGRTIAFSGGTGQNAQSGIREFFATSAAAGERELFVLPPDSDTPVSLCEADQVETFGGKALFLRHESASGGPGCPAGSQNEDADVADRVAYLWDGAGSPRNLGIAASAVAMSGRWLAALASEPGEGIRLNDDADTDDSVAFVRGHDAGAWINLGRAADRIAAGGSTVAFTTPEIAEGGADLNGDGRFGTPDGFLGVLDGAGDLIDTGQEAEDFVVGATGLVALRTREAKQGFVSLNAASGHDFDLADDVLQVFVPWAEEGHRLVSTGMAVRPCALEACDPRLPYRVLEDTVRFLSFECDQGGPVTAGCPSGGTDLDGDGRADHLVLQILNVAEMMAGASMEQSCNVLAATQAGVCTDTAEACTRDEDCVFGTCFVPPGGCIVDYPGRFCNPQAPSACDGADEFCQPTGSLTGFCRALQRQCHGGPLDGSPCMSSAQCLGGTCTARCRGRSDCSGAATCNQSDQNFQRLANPLKTGTESRSTAVFVGAGRCVEARGDAGSCMVSSDCPAGEFCDGTQCLRDHGVCRTSDDCPPGSACEQDLIAQTAADVDEDEVPDFLDNCASVANVDQRDLDGDGTGDRCDAQTCGNGIIEPGEICDDGNRRNGDGCDCAVPDCRGGIDRARISLARLGGRGGDESLNLSGRLRLPAELADVDLASLVASGVQVLVEDLGRNQLAVLDLSARTAAIPSVAGSGCDPRDGWRPRAQLGGLTYHNRSDRLPTAGCTPGSAHGLRRLELVDRRKTAGSIDFRLFVRRSSLGEPIGPLQVTLALGGGSLGDLDARCGTRRFGAGQCEHGTQGHELRCR